MCELKRILLLTTLFCIVIISDVYAGTCWNGGYSGTAPWTVKNSSGSDSCEYIDVAYCLNTVAATGDTVNLPACTATWSNRLVITKAVSIIGAGIGTTVIVGTYTPSLSGGSFDASKHLISIEPANPSDNPVIRISGMTINVGTNSHGIWYRNTSLMYETTKIRLDHLDLSASSYAFQWYGLAFGVMDNCLIKGSLNNGGHYDLWQYNGYSFGTTSNMYFEDNIWRPYSETSSYHMWGSGSGRSSFRYNTIVLPNSAQTFPLWDIHGNHCPNNICQYASGFGGEFYGNYINSPDSHATYLLDQRGGKVLFFYNYASYTTGDIKSRLREEYSDSLGLGPSINAINGQPQHISDTYYWSNKKNTDQLDVIRSTTDYLIDSDNKEVPLEDEHFFNYKTSFNGTTGMGCGTAENMYNIKPLKIGVGFWVTDQNNCSDLTGYVGDIKSNPTRKKIFGTLYKWNGYDWIYFYEPYTYPHPLRGTITISGGISISGGSIQ